jgi:hypothetical protein
MGTKASDINRNRRRHPIDTFVWIREVVLVADSEPMYQRRSVWVYRLFLGRASPDSGSGDSAQWERSSYQER